MKAVICEKYGPPEVLKIKEVDKPSPEPNELLIKVMSTTVNSADVRIRGLAIPGFFVRVIMRLVMGFRGPRKGVLGVTLSGVVEQVGNSVKGFKPGDKVYASMGLKFGAHAEYVTIREDKTVTLMPVKASFDEAAAIPFGGSSALYFLGKAKIVAKPREKVLIYGSSGAVGTAAVQIAKYHKAEVTAVCSQDGVALAKSLGADHVIVYSEEDFTDNGKHYDVIFDAVEKKPKKECANSLTEGGRYTTVGSLDVAKESKQQLEFLRNLFDKGQYKAVIDRTYPLEEIAEAHRYVDKGHKKGNVVIKVSS